MAKIGEYRLKIYELLYERPICEYAETVGKKKEQNVLILGNGWAGNEAFKGIFWAGQSLNSGLNITVASRNALTYKSQVLSTESGALLPALKFYAEQKHYANFCFININVEEGGSETGLAALDFLNNKYNYIVVSLGDAEHNWLAASELITQINNAQNNGAKYTGKIIVNVFNEFSDGIASDDCEALIKYGIENHIEVHFFGGESAVSGELNRIARNLNFSYGMKYNQRISKKTTDEQFEISRISEFVDSPFDYEVGDVNILSNFIGAEYAADSSFASAVHIPVKLNMCREAAPEKDPLDTLKEAVQKKNNLYLRLVALEHRRWNAYTIMRGFRAPTVKEEAALLYQNGNTHQDKQRLLHICLCDCGEKAALENNFDRQYRLWLNRKCPKDFPSELDRASLRAHQLVIRLSEQIDINQVLDSISGDNPEYMNLRRSIIKLANDEDNSLALYQKSLESALKFAVSVSEKEVDMIHAADGMLMPVKTRNARTDFFKLDAQLVEMIPFALWYGKKYGTVITVSDGMSAATHDVIIPTLFCACNALFIGKVVSNKKYQNAITAYFENRGSNTKPQFISVSTMDIDSIYECIEKQIQKYGHHNLVINCVPNRGYDGILAVGRLMEKYSGEINVVQYLPNKGIVSFCPDKNIGVGLDNKCYSLSEFIQLMGGRVINEYANLYDSTQYESLFELFRAYCKVVKIKNKDNGTKKFNIWAEMTGFFSRIAKDESYEDCIKGVYKGQTLHYQGTFSDDVFSRGMIGKTLLQLQEHRIIQNYSEESGNETVGISFDHSDPEIESLLHIFENGQMEYGDSFKALKFIPFNGGLKISNRLVQEAQLFTKEEPKQQADIKQAFMEELARRGYISELIIDQGGTASFVFKDEPTMHILKNQGSVFELVVYYLMRESGMFDDIETGIKIAWEAEDTPLEQMLLDGLNVPGYNGVGYSSYVKMRKEILRQVSSKEAQAVKNEIDVIALKGMNVIMVSCKTAENDSMQWIYEIKSVSEHFLSTGVMAVSWDYSNKSKSSFIERAKQMDISLWGTETLWNPERLREALQDVIKQSQK